MANGSAALNRLVAERRPANPVLVATRSAGITHEYTGFLRAIARLSGVRHVDYTEFDLKAFAEMFPKPGR